jgi:tetratricopeptide (TPR) repeat protein/tRNA A-37 threonylcarbamoyl transferase component Bud32
MDCLDDNTVLAFVERLLPAADHERVARHLDDCEACLAIACAAAQSPGTDDREPAAVGEVVGRYALVELIGRGGMGSVYVAHDPQLDRKVALKLVRSARYAQRDVKDRLSREARAMAKVTHAHVVTVYDAGELDDGVFIAMELVDGQTLARWLTTTPRTWREVVRVFVDVGRGLHAAHAVGVVHRDFKPENVLVDRTGRAAVTDFGLALANDPAPTAELVDISLDDTHPLTRTGALVGTPRFMSPEQFRGQTVDARSDQFSFAVALYAALYHAYPYEGTTVGELLAAVTRGALPPRPEPTDVPIRVHHVLVRALSTDVAERYPTMAALLDELDAALHPSRRRAALVAGLALACVAAGGVWLWAAHAPASSPPPALAPTVLPPIVDGLRAVAMIERFTNTTGDAKLDDTLDVAVEEELYRSVKIDPLGGMELEDLATQLKGDVHDVDALAKNFVSISDVPVIAIHGSVARDGSGYVVALDAAGHGHEIFRDRARAADAGGLLTAAATLANELRVKLGDRPEPAIAMSSSLDAVHDWIAGTRLSQNGDINGATTLYQRAVAADPTFADARSSYGLSLYNAGRLEQAATELERAFRDGDRMPARQRLTVMGDYYGTIGHFKEAIAAYEQLLARWPKDVRTQVNMTATALDESDFTLALEFARAATADHTNIVVIRGNLILAELATGRFADVVRDGAKMLVDFPEPSPFAVVAIASAHELLGNRDAARATLAKLDATQPDLAETGRAELAFFEGDLAEAERRTRGMIASATAKNDLDSQRLQSLTLARILLARGDRSGATLAATAAMGTGSPRPEYLAASVAVAAGNETGAADKVRVWVKHPVEAWRVAGKLLEADLALAHHKPRDAVAAVEEAAQLGATWLVHARLVRAYAEAGDRAAAQHELQWCVDHRGEGAAFMSPSPSMIFELESLAPKLGLAVP